MTSVDKCGLPGKCKAWGFQHGVLPRLLWPMLEYEVPLLKVKALGRKLNNFLRRWLAVPTSFCSIGLYSTGSKLQLPISSVVEEFKATKASQVLMLWDSKDEMVCQVLPQVRRECSKENKDQRDTCHSRQLGDAGRPQEAAALPEEIASTSLRPDIVL